MFRIEVFVDDKNVGPALRALTGIALGQPGVMPVINATATKQGVVPASPAGSHVELFFEHLRKQSVGTTLARRDVDAFATGHGRSRAAAQHLLRRALRDGLLKQEGTGIGNKNVIYRIVNTGGKKP
jgi:hypothetical protein